jgi:MSHA pilin protein MshA
MQHQRGFTLIELIIVIVILGILAVTVAPKFIDI